MPALLPLRHWAYRSAFRALQVIWFVRRPHKRGVKCLITDGERILLVRHTYGPGAWDLPGGAIKRHETPLAAARREMGEELGVVQATWTPIGEVRGRVDHRHDEISCFRAELPTPVLTVDPVELAVARWFSPRDLPADLAPYVMPIVSHTVPAPAPAPSAPRPPQPHSAAAEPTRRP
ncbi:MAG: NUDIX domain-containing protein [Solirubrobacteraceae bacterium]|jgi:8-oxo-dGTP pyrophosphatase MutT (NUDIX family)